ncbi:hypothetical protein MKX03_032651 [Papaver bracteatum]|nr:hypothetical protein MKX03_032651 [Papaver bracteatum]
MSEANLEEAVQIQQTHTPLLSGLPDDIALFCLARVPRRYHTLLKCMSKRWRDLVCSEHWVSYRRPLERACLYVLDPISLKRCWKLVPSLPDQCLKRKGMAFEVLGKCYFACEALNEKLYAIGGVGSNLSDPHSCDMYDPSTNKLDLSLGSKYFVYKPSSGTWEHTDKDLVYRVKAAIVVEGNLYVLEHLILLLNPFCRCHFPCFTL